MCSYQSGDFLIIRNNEFCEHFWLAKLNTLEVLRTPPSHFQNTPPINTSFRTPTISGPRRTC